MKQYENKSIDEKFKIWKDNYLSKNQTLIIHYYYIYYSNEFKYYTIKNKLKYFKLCI